MYIEVGYPPSVNRLWRAVPGRGVIKSKIYREWLEANLWLVKAQGRHPIKGKFSIIIQAVRPDKRKRDIDNIIKPLLDLITQAGLIEDDSDCEYLTAGWITNGTGIKLTIEPTNGIPQAVEGETTKNK